MIMYNENKISRDGRRRIERRNKIDDIIKSLLNKIKHAIKKKILI